MAPSSTQRKLLAQLSAGSRLFLDARTGRYQLKTVTGATSPVGHQTVAALIRQKLLHQTLGAECLRVPLPPPPMIPQG